MPVIAGRLDLDGLGMVFGEGADRAVALENINLSVDNGELVCIVGASGCGKSTLLSLIAGLLEPTSGRVLLDQMPVTGPGPDRGLVFQNYSLYPWRSVAENVGFGLELTELRRPDVRARVEYYLEVVGLARWADARPSQLSGGMRQRVAIARSLATEPEVLLLDEPFGALDPQTKSAMHEFLLSIWQRTGTTILQVTHDVEEAIYLGQRVYVFASHPGRVKAEVDVPWGDSGPRDPGIRRTTEFLELREHVNGLLLEEIADV